MTQLKLVDPATATGETKTLLEVVQGTLGVVPNLFRVAANSPAALEGLVHLNGAVAKGSFDARLRERIALAVAEANGSAYCLSAHCALGSGAGLSSMDIEAARAARASDGRATAVLRLAREIVETRGAIPATALRAAREEGLSDAEIVEVVANVVVNIFTNYLNLVADTEIDFPAVTPRLAKAA